MKADEGWWKVMRINEGRWRRMGVNEGRWRSMKANGGKWTLVIYSKHNIVFCIVDAYMVFSHEVYAITSHLFRARLCHAKNEAPEEAGGGWLKSIFKVKSEKQKSKVDLRTRVYWQETGTNTSYFRTGLRPSDRVQIIAWLVRIGLHTFLFMRLHDGPAQK